MIVKDLIEALSKYSDNTTVMILDGFNGGGQPRTINCSPCIVVVQDTDIKDNDDCEGLEGEKIVVMGYGSY